jgi:hypothetical protein
MNEIDLIDKTQYLLEKYLEENRAKSVLSEFKTALNEGRNIGKQVLHILGTEKKMEFDVDDKNLIKDVAFNLGL